MHSAKGFGKIAPDQSRDETNTVGSEAFSDLGQPEPTTTYRSVRDCQIPANTKFVRTEPAREPISSWSNCTESSDCSWISLPQLDYPPELREAVTTLGRYYQVAGSPWRQAWGRQFLLLLSQPNKETFRPGKHCLLLSILSCIGSPSGNSPPPAQREASVPQPSCMRPIWTCLRATARRFPTRHDLWDMRLA